MNLEQWSYVATLLGLPAIAVSIVFEIWRTGKDRDRETHLELNRRYGDFLRLALERPELELADFLTADQVSDELEDRKHQYQKLVALQSLVSIFEDAHFLFNDKQGSLRREAWRGWEAYIAYWMQRPDFRSAWHSHFASQYNTSFMSYMEKRWPAQQFAPLERPASRLVR